MAGAPHASDRQRKVMAVQDATNATTVEPSLGSGGDVTVRASGAGASDGEASGFGDVNAGHGRAEASGSESEEELLTVKRSHVFHASDAAEQSLPLRASHGSGRGCALPTTKRFSGMAVAALTRRMQMDSQTDCRAQPICSLQACGTRATPFLQRQQW
jgi:hypothetical protein